MVTTLWGGLKQALGAVLCFAAVGCTTYSGRGDTWMHKSEAMAEDRQMQAKNMMPVAIDCRIEDPYVPQYATRVTWGPNNKGQAWGWHVGNAKTMRAQAAEAARRKQKLVQSKKMSDAKSGFQGSCAIWRSPGNGSIVGKVG